jgi:hypothetical protein
MLPLPSTDGCAAQLLPAVSLAPGEARHETAIREWRPIQKSTASESKKAPHLLAWNEATNRRPPSPGRIRALITDEARGCDRLKSPPSFERSCNCHSELRQNRCAGVTNDVTATRLGNDVVQKGRAPIVAHSRAAQQPFSSPLWAPPA